MSYEEGDRVRVKEGVLAEDDGRRCGTVVWARPGVYRVKMDDGREIVLFSDDLQLESS